MQKGKERHWLTSPLPGKISSLPSFKLSLEEVFKQAEDKEVFRQPRPIKKWLPRINQNRYRRFYRITDHHIDDCRELKEQIKSLIRRGQLTNFISKPEETTHPILSFIMTCHLSLLGQPNKNPQVWAEIRMLMEGNQCAIGFWMKRWRHDRDA